MTVQPITSERAVYVGLRELSALIAQVRELSGEDFARPTDCIGWTVRDIVAHMTGALDEAVHPLVLLRHMTLAKTRDRTLPPADSLSAQQIADRRDKSDAEVVDQLRGLAPRAPLSRAKIPSLVRRASLPDPAALPGDTLGYLLDVIYTRDVWMHRVDISRATGCPMPDSGVEVDVVGQVIRDLQRGWHGEPLTLTLTGRVDGEWGIGGPGPRLSVDTVAFCRLLSGRSDEVSLGENADEATRRVADALRQHRILF